MTPARDDDGKPPRAGTGRTFLLALSVTLLALTLWIVWPFKGTITFALVLGFLLHPTFEWLKPRVRYGPLAAGILLLAVAVALVLPFIILGVRLAEDVQMLFQAMQSRGTMTAALENLLQSLGVPADSVSSVAEQVQTRLASAAEGVVVPAVTAVTHFVLALVVFFILLYFVLVDGPRLVHYLRHNLPLDQKRADQLVTQVGGNVRAIILGTIGVSVIQGFVAGVGWALLGLPRPVFWGFVMMVLSVVPVAGAFIVLIPAAIWAFAQGNIIAGAGLLVLNFIMVGLVDDAVRPYLIGRQSGVHPAVILVGIVGGVLVFGPTGFILGPLILSLLGPVIEAWAHPEEKDALAPNGGASEESRD